MDLLRAILGEKKISYVGYSYGTYLGTSYRTGIAHVAGEVPGEPDPLPLCRLRFTGVLHTWGFALYLTGRDKYEDNFLPTGLPFGSPEEALDCACGLYLGDPPA